MSRRWGEIKGRVEPNKASRTCYWQSRNKHLGHILRSL